MIPCNVSPASEEIADFIVRYSPRAVDSLYELAQTRCVNLVSQEYAIVHAPLSGVLPLSFTQHTYSAIPKLYGLQDTTALEATGILPVFSQPNLMSTGQGILIGMIDTGIDYTNPLFQNRTAPAGSCGSGIRLLKVKIPRKLWPDSSRFTAPSTARKT